MQARSEQIGVGGTQISFWIAGDGPSMLLLHGAGESGADWLWVLPQLAARYQVVAPDLPVRMRTTRPGEGIRPAQFAEFVGEFLDTLQMPQAVVVGNSLGGLIAIRFALAHPERVLALVLVDSIGLGQEINPTIQWIISPGGNEMSMSWAVTTPGVLSRAWMRAGLYFARPNRAPNEWIEEQQSLALLPGVMQAWGVSLRFVVGPAGQQEVMLDQLGGLTMPTLLVWGERDGVVPHCHARHALERLPHGRFRLIADCGHLPQVEQPEEFVRAVRDFLAEEFEPQPEAARTRR